MKIGYKYPVVYFYSDDLEDSDITMYKAELDIRRSKSEPYEAFISTNSSLFHILLGTQNDGNFLCIPNWHTGCDLVEYENVEWNLRSLLQKEQFLSYEDATAVIYGIKEFSKYI